jgi:hypothetical protein
VEAGVVIVEFGGSGRTLDGARAEPGRRGQHVAALAGVVKNF